MRIWIAAVDRVKSGPARDLYEEYARRLNWPLTLREVEEKRTLPPEQRRASEAGRLLSAVPEGAVLVALDEKGESLSSMEFARKLASWRDRGAGDVAFLIGGADGHDEELRRKADLVLSLGAMTWPHLLVRGMLAEQLYRAQTILTNHPYHREG